MKIIGTAEGKKLYVHLIGELDHHSAKKTRDDIDRLLMNSYITELTIDMKDVSFMDSSGLGVILGRYKILAERKGSVRICGANRSVDKILRMSGIYSLVERS